jgi:GNAT superfamily N-acetyltransferase
MTAEVRVRTAVPADRDAVVALIRALNIYEAAITGDRLVSQAAAEAYYAGLIDRIARQDGRLLAAAAGRSVVGILGLIVQEDQVFVREEVRRHGYVSDLVVDETWRGRGVGRLLLGEAERLTREKGLNRLVIGVMAGNDGAERLYAELGFAVYAKAMMKPLAC